MLHEGRIVARGTVNDFDRERQPLVQAFMRSAGGG
jgi:ABC-type transporter Mla maintaining outer membrane lipid asymmetry ATPase subunit MlaF